MVMDKINPSSYLSDITPILEAAQNASNWYEDDLRYITEPSDGTIGWMNAQGWEVADVDGGVYTFKRRTIKSEYALNSLILSITGAYNEGRDVNDRRYDDLIALQTATLDKAEDVLIALETDEDAFEELADAIIDNIETDFTTHNADVSGDLSTWGDAQRARIDNRYDGKLASQEAGMISSGKYNTITWEAAEVGIERERDDALTELEDRILERQLVEKNRLYQFKQSMRDRVFAARSRLISLLQSQGKERLNFRDRIIAELSNFAERRTDSYPDLGQVSKIVSDMGTTDASSIVP